jgi:hypothetical protein
MLINVNNILSILKTDANESDHEIQKLENGEKILENADKLDDATLSRYKDETLTADDDKIPTAFFRGGG